MRSLRCTRPFRMSFFSASAVAPGDSLVDSAGTGELVRSEFELAELSESAISRDSARELLPCARWFAAAPGTDSEHADAGRSVPPAPPAAFAPRRRPDAGLVSAAKIPPPLDAPPPPPPPQPPVHARRMSGDVDLANQLRCFVFVCSRSGRGHSGVGVAVGAAVVAAVGDSTGATWCFTSDGFERRNRLPSPRPTSFARAADTHSQRYSSMNRSGRRPAAQIAHFESIRRHDSKASTV